MDFGHQSPPANPQAVELCKISRQCYPIACSSIPPKQKGWHSVRLGSSRAGCAFLVAATLAIRALVSTSYADDSALVAALKAKGAEVTEAQGEVTGLSFKSKVSFTEAEAQQIRQLAHLKTFSCGGGFDDAALSVLSGAPELENFSSNGLDASDEGIRILGTCKKLKSAAFFHPGRKFTGTGLAALADLPSFERLTVAGSTEINDEGMAAIAKLKHLKEFRVWHSGVSAEGIKKLQALPELKSLTVGQRLAYKPPVTVSDDTVSAVAGCGSLESLSLQEARLTLPALSQLKKLTHLRKLSLDGIELSDSDLAALKQQLPQTDVKWTAPNESAKKRIDALFGAR